MELWRLLGIPRGVTAVTGSGGKTTLLRTLGEELPGRVILCATTHILPFEDVALYTGASEGELAELLARRRLVCVGRWGEEGKLVAPGLPMRALAGLADHVLVEADGSRRLPLKAHAPHEPVIPPESGQVVCVVGASGFGRRVEEAVHRPEIFCRLTGAERTDPVTPALAALAVVREGLARQVFINQVDAPEDWARAEAFARAAVGSGIAVCAGSLRRGIYRPLRKECRPESVGHWL